MPHTKHARPWHILSLKFFDTEKEAAFRESDYQTHIDATRLALVLSPFVYLAYSIFDYILLPDCSTMVMIRFSCAIILAPLFMIVWIRPHYTLGLLSLGILMFGYGLTMCIGVHLYDEAYALYFVTGLVMTNTYSVLLFGLRLTQSVTVIFALSIICFLVVYTKFDTPSTLIISFHILFTMGLFLSWAVYRLEYSKRIAFMKQIEIFESQSKLALSEDNRHNWLKYTTNFLRHELRNAFRGASSSLEMFKRFNPDYDSDKYLKRAEQSLKLSSRLLNNIGDATALESQLTHEDRYTLDLKETINDFVNVLPAPSKQLKVEFSASSTKNYLVNANTERLIQVLDNLLSNAVDHAKPDSCITIRLSTHQNNALLVIENEGVPLPSDKASIFRAFVSMRSGDTYTQDNMGVGLYMVKTVIEAYGGHVQALDLAGKSGASICIELPLIES